MDLGDLAPEILGFGHLVALPVVLAEGVAEEGRFGLLPGAHADEGGAGVIEDLPLLDLGNLAPEVHVGEGALDDLQLGHHGVLDVLAEVLAVVVHGLLHETVGRDGVGLDGRPVDRLVVGLEDDVLYQVSQGGDERDRVRFLNVGLLELLETEFVEFFGQERLLGENGLDFFFKGVDFGLKGLVLKLESLILGLKRLVLSFKFLKSLALKEGLGGHFVLLLQENSLLIHPTVRLQKNLL